MDPISRKKLAYSLSKFLNQTYCGEGGRTYNSIHVHVPVELDHENSKETLAVLDPEDFLSQAIRYYQHCRLDPRSHKDERRLIEIKERLDDKYGGFLKENKLLKYTAQRDWLEEAIKFPTHESKRGGWRYRYQRDKPAAETPDEKPRVQLKCTIDSEMEELTATIESSFSLLKPFDYTERYSLHYIIFRKYSGDENMTHLKAEREARIRLDEYKAEHFERMCEESRQLSEWEERKKMRDWKYWKEIENNPDDFISEDDFTSEAGESEEEGCDDNESEGEESEGERSEDDGSESDGASSSAGMDIDLPEPTSEDLTTQISVLRISGKKSNGEGGRVKMAKKRPFDDIDDTEDVAASGYKRAKIEHWRERFVKYGWMRVHG
ncbi:hypothetical protein FDENT_9707 [Fusarium denticulatum]|uniref:Uncharacterized protein n=1 Tax=Fusarium denticulatum TaxID=48507 RepID=A0A8H5WU40_9HYPO|nr:hypothetical protein FDENT_9707 [Fusarium denticulatum]